MKIPKLPDGKSLGFLFNIASGKQLEIWGEPIGVYRIRWWIFKEWDYSYKNRIIAEILMKESEKK